jgi:hypothetical protein
MAKFCANCGSSLGDAAIFCGACAARVPVASAPLAQETYSPPQAYASVPAAKGKKSNSLLEFVIAAVVLLCLGSALALAAVYYAAHRISQRAHQVAARTLGENGASESGGLLGGSAVSQDAGFQGDPCRFLSNADVSHAVGMPVIRSERKDDGCSYIAKGDPADVTTRHAASMVGSLGADAQTQKTVQKFAGALFAQQEAADKSLSAEAATGEIPVLVVSFTSGNAQMEMKLNRGAFGGLKSDAPTPQVKATADNSASGELTGIGDEAYVAGGSLIMVRKGNTVARFMYISCPCNTDNIKPLAQKLASRL